MKKTNLPVPDCPGGSGTKTPADDAIALQQAVDQAVSQSLVSQTGVLAYEIQKMIKQYVDAAYNREPWKKYTQSYSDALPKDVYDSNQKRPMKSAGPETAPNQLRKDIPPEMFDADKRTPMRQYRNQNAE